MYSAVLFFWVIVSVVFDFLDCEYAVQDLVHATR
jgi:hypothetical protein